MVAARKNRTAVVGIGQTTLGKALGVTFQQIRKPEKGIDPFGSGRLFDIAEVIEWAPPMAPLLVIV